MMNKKQLDPRAKEFFENAWADIQGFTNEEVEVLRKIAQDTLHRAKVKEEEAELMYGLSPKEKVEIRRMALRMLAIEENNGPSDKYIEVDSPSRDEDLVSDENDSK